MKFIYPQAINHYFNIHHDTLDEIRNKLKGTPHMKKSNSRCSWVSGKHYYLYDMDYLIDVMGFKPKMKIPDSVIR